MKDLVGAGGGKWAVAAGNCQRQHCAGQGRGRELRGWGRGIIGLRGPLSLKSEHSFAEKAAPNRGIRVINRVIGRYFQVHQRRCINLAGFECAVGNDDAGIGGAQRGLRIKREERRRCKNEVFIAVQDRQLHKFIGFAEVQAPKLSVKLLEGSMDWAATRLETKGGAGGKASVPNETTADAAPSIRPV